MTLMTCCKMKTHPKLINIFFCIVSEILLIMYLSIYWNKTYPITDGWGLYYSELLFSGKVPYRDFYYYLPPLNLLIDGILWKLSFGYLLLYRVYRIIERLLILFLLYELLCKVVKPFYACIGAFIGVLLSTATVYDLCGDYNQTAEVIPIILGFILLKYLEYGSSKEITKQYRCLVYIGILIAFAFFIKQTVFVATGIVAFLTLTIIYVRNNKLNVHGYIMSVITTFAGFVIPLLIGFLVLYINGALVPFFEQVFLNAGSKGSLGSILSSIFRITFTYKNIYLAVTIVFCFYMIKRRTKERLIYLFIMISTFYFSFQEKIDTIIFLKETDKGNIVIIAFIVLLVISLCINVFLDDERWNNIFSALYIVGIAMLILLLPGFDISCQRLYNETYLFALISDLTILCSALCFISIFYFIYKYYKDHDISDANWLVVFACAIIVIYYEGMTTINGFNARALCIVFPVLCCFVMKEIKKYESLKMAVGFMICAILVAGVISQKVSNAYSWWGWSEATLNEEHFYKVNVKAFRGIEFSEDEAIMYNELFNVLEDNSDKTDTIYSFPHAKIFNVVLNNTNMDDSFVPVPFYDVCSDEYAREDAIRLEKDPPEILIWCDMPNCMETHEEIFRDGKPLGQRSIQRVFKRLIMQDKYTLIGQYNNMFIYKLNNNEKINYTYIQDPLRVNLTLMQK